jgi:hypothetical protein
MKTAIGNDDLGHEWYVVEINGNRRGGRKEMYHLLSSFVSAVSQLWKATAYHPERHYMRGPGPKWREKN